MRPIVASGVVRGRVDLTPLVLTPSSSPCIILPSRLRFHVAVAEDAPAEATTAEATQARRHILTDIPEANDDIDTVHTFPDFGEGGNLPSGETLKVLLGFRNNGESPMNVSHISGSVNAPQQFSFYVVNFTTAEYKAIVEPGKEATFEYQFFLDPQLAGHSFQIAFTAFYQDDAELYASTFFNSTVGVLDPVGVFDTQTVFMSLSLLGIAAVSVYLGLQATGMLPAVKATMKKMLGGGAKRKTETGTGRNHDSNEWLKGTSWDAEGKKAK